jgi:carbonic anhydrase/acetyltransferase-like protein (isoleucine patch superfamily)
MREGVCCCYDYKKRRFKAVFFRAVPPCAVLRFSTNSMIRPYRGHMPRIGESSYIDLSAQIIGDVVIGERSSVWLNVSARGDVNYIRIGDETSIQDNTVLHVDHDLYPLIIGNRVTVGHSVVLHGCEVGDDALIGIGAIVLNGAKIGTGAVVAAGSLVPERMEVPANMLVMGAPAKVRREVTPDEQERFRKNCDNYVRITAVYKEEQP